jgi:predicted nucleic acid-binding protein
MKHLFIDTNVLIDFLVDRQPFSEPAALLFNQALKGKLKLYISADSFSDTYYILKRFNTHQATIKQLKEIETLIEIVDVTRRIIKLALDSNFKDFEDAIQYYCAKSNDKIDAIISRNARDFKLSSLPVLSPNEVVKVINI